MADNQKGIGLTRWLITFLKGAVMGVGAVLPGISGGVLCVIFGLYQPMLELFSEPRKAFPKYKYLVLPIVAGFLAGFVLLAGAIAELAAKEATVVTSLFIGLIAGMFPQLFQDGKKEGRTRSCWMALIISTVLLLVFFLLIKYSVAISITPSWGWFYFCGSLWGISLIAPGMSSSSLLILLGLYYPMSKGIAELDPGVIIPFLLGIAITAMFLAKGVNTLFKKHYGPAYHSIIGFVIASTAPIIPTSFKGTFELILSVAVAVGGFFAAYLLSKLDDKQK